jgi:hypothetical protein
MSQELTENELVAVVWKIITEAGDGGVSESRLIEKIKHQKLKVRKSLFQTVLLRMSYYTIRTTKGERWFVTMGDK